MDITRNSISDTQVELTVTASEEKLKELKKHVLEKLQRDVDAPGFRKGKAPLNVVEKQVKDDVLQAQFMEESVSHLYNDAITDEKLRVLEQPKIEIITFVPFSQLTFKATVSVVPPVKLGAYPTGKKLPKVSVKKADIEEVLENLQKRSAEKKEVDRKAKEDDEVWIDFKGADADGKEVPGAGGKDYPLQIGSNSFIPGFEPELIGLKKDDTKTFAVTFPEDYGHKPLAGEEVTFDVTVKSVKEVVLPEITDELAAKLGPFKSVDELKEDIKLQLEKQKNQEATDALKDEIVGEVVEASTVVVPDVLLEDQVKLLRDDFTRNLTYRGITLKEYLEQQGTNEEDFEKNELRPKAEKRVQAGLVLAEISDTEGIGVSEEELSIRMQLMKGQNQQQAAEFDKPEVRRDIASRMLTEKTVEFLVEKATKKS